MNKKKSLITALLLVVIAGLSIVAGTFAYFQWTTGAEGGTSVNVTIEMGGITMHIEPEETEFVGLYPTAHCENNVRYGDALVTIVNNTGTLALPSFKLKVKVTDKDGNGVPADALSHIHYSVVPIETTKSSDNPVKGETTYTCANIPSVNSTDAGGLLTNGEGNVTSSFTFTGVATDGSYTHVPSVNDISSTGVATTAGYLPRQYFISGSKLGETAGITYIGDTYTTTYQYYRVYVWIDEGYTSTIVGNVVSDPLQNAKIEITWSEESMVQQVSGESNNTEPVPAAGLYDNDGNVVKTWQQLLDNGDIRVEDNVVTASNIALTGNLVISEGIKAIGGSAFVGGYLTKIEIPSSVTSVGEFAFGMSQIGSITFASGSRLTEIGEQAFAYSSLTSFEIPASVTSIGASAFSSNGFGDNLTFAPGSQITEIGEGAFSEAGLTSFEIPASVITIGSSAFSGNKFGDNFTFASGSQIIEIGDSAFSGSEITSIEIPASVTTIGSGAFSYTGLTSVEIPASVISIGASAFSGNNFGDNLTFASGSQITEIGDDAFAGSWITSIEIPASVTSIGASAFNGNNFGDNLTFEQNSQLQTIDDYAFSTAGITSVEFPASLRRIGSYAFSMNNFLSSLKFKGTTTAWNSIEKGDEWNFAVPATKVICSDGEVSL